MTENVHTDAREISFQQLLDRLAPGTRLTVVFYSMLGEECRRHRIVTSVGDNVVRLRTGPSENEAIVEIVYAPGRRIFALTDGFLLVFDSGITTRYYWGHV